MYRKMSHDTLSERRKAACFGVTLVLIMMVSVVTIFMSSGPIVLGSEMNTNGMVEYLCLGTSCTDLF